MTKALFFFAGVATMVVLFALGVVYYVHHLFD